MYRTKQWLQEETELLIPIVIISYNRADAPIFKSKIMEIGKDKVFLGIRREELPKYKQYLNRVTPIFLENVVDSGTTRQAVLDWADTRGFEYIFMLDDRVKSVNYLVPRTTKNKRIGLVAGSKSPLDGFLVWQRILRDNHLTVSCPSHRGFSWMPENIDAPVTINNGNCAACVAINVRDVFNAGIKYITNAISGHEDFQFMLEILLKGLPTSKLTDLEYDEVASRNIPVGGNHDNAAFLERTQARTTTSINYAKSIKALPISYYIRKSGGGIYPYFNWKFWRGYYEEVQKCITQRN